MDSNNNFISDYYYAAVELEITKDVDDNETSGVYDNIFQTVWYIESLKDDGTHPPIKNAGTVGSDAEANQMGKTYFSFEKGETKKLILYCIFTDEEVENDTIALSFHDRTSPYIGPFLTPIRIDNNNTAITAILITALFIFFFIFLPFK